MWKSPVAANYAAACLPYYNVWLGLDREARGWRLWRELRWESSTATLMANDIGWRDPPSVRVGGPLRLSFPQYVRIVVEIFRQQRLVYSADQFLEDNMEDVPVFILAYNQASPGIANWNT